MRGTERGRSDMANECRITPACAGNRYILYKALLCLWDHPRVCGEQKIDMTLPLVMWGSPPRVRGTVIPQLQKPPGLGITPACAGNSCRRARLPLGAWDHPRVCGEQPDRIPSLPFGLGSPPRVRGTDSDFLYIPG